MQPHVRIKLVEFEATLAAFLAAPGDRIKPSLDQFLRVNEELIELSYVTHGKALHEIVDAFSRADEALDREMKRLRLQ